ncbi:MAG: PP2C family protein-serine/threonine phosphatase [Saprospiraceae bacterium]
MSDLANIKSQLGKLEEYERELHLKQLQINNLLSITQAINSNHSAVEIYTMYSNFLGFVMSIKKMALYFAEDGKWDCVCSIGLSPQLQAYDATPLLKDYRRLSSILDKEDPLLSQFDNIIPVFHKETPIAHVLLGGFSDFDDRYNKIQFITALTNVIAVAMENKRLFKRQIEQEALRQEMKLASEMQMTLVPTVMPQGDKYELDSVYIPHLSVGGDVYDFIQFDKKNRLICCIADISGKGLAAALLMANFQANLRSIIRRRDSPETFIKLLNKAIFRITKGERFITFFIAEFDQNSRVLRYINAGHTPPYLYMNGQLQTLNLGCTFLGWLDNLPGDINIGEIQIPGDALLVCFTDGVTDVINANGVHFGDDGLAEFISQTGICGAAEFNAKLLSQLDQYKGTENYSDDFTLVTLRMFA